MSSLIDDLNSRAYASEGGGLRVCHCSDCDAKPEPACVVCRCDCIALNDAGECAECEPREDETCEDWLARTKARRQR